jgi:O-antigen ligase
MIFKNNQNFFTIFLNKAIQLGLLLLLFLLPFQTRYIYHSAFVHGNFWEYGSQTIYATELLVWILIILSLVKVFLNRQKLNLSFTQNPVWKRILILSMPFVGLFLMFISIIKSVDPGQSWYFVFHFLETVSLISVFIISEISFEKSVLALWLGGVVQALLAIAQFYLQEVFASKWLGMALHLPSHFGAGVIETGSGRWLRAYGSFGWPNSLGFYLAIVWVLGFVFYSKFYLPKKSKLLLALFTAGQMIILSGLVLSFSRAAWIAAIVGLITLVCLIVKKNNSSEEKYYQNIYFLCRQLISATGLVLFFVATLSSLFFTRLNPVTRLEAISLNDRLNQYAEAQKIITQHFWFGVGPGNYSNYLAKIQPSLQVWELQPVHNIFLLEMAEIGVLFSIFHSLLFLFLISFVLKRNRLFLPIILTLLLTGVFDHWGWSLYGGQLLWGVVFGIVLVKQKE